MFLIARKETSDMNLQEGTINNIVASFCKISRFR